jgi:3-hydroxyacyl-[acyl-carrier-protein] dehydratase
MYNEVLNHLPYKSSFRFVDNISSLDENGAIGDYTFKPGSFFYEDHFVGYPVTPGIIITEVMAQIGLVVLGIYLILKSSGDIEMETGEKIFPLLTSSEISFYKMVLPGEKVTVVSKKEYFRFNKLKCYIEMMDEKNELIARGMFSGTIKKTDLKNPA